MSSPFAGAATGIGSWPGTDVREAAATVVGELARLPHVVELPARGVGADLIGRTSALLVDLDVDANPRGYRLGSRRSAVARRAHDLLRTDLDAFEEARELSGSRAGVVKLQAAGPLTLAAGIELPNGHRVVADPGARRDVAESLAEGLTRHVAEVRRRFAADVVLQLDEPSIAAVLAGTLPGVSRLQPVPPLPAPDALALLDTVSGAVDVPVAVHSCGSPVPWELLRRSSAAAVAVDVSQLAKRDLDGVGELVESGKDLLLGLVPGTAPAAAPTWRELARPAVTLIDRLGFTRAMLRERVGVSPVCGLAGASQSWARAALELTRQIADVFADEPEAL
ncbi:methionine synthase [Skermania piniformis]|uniref:Methionine synthase n=1 Tax=Skermania pinensis TaxID=39122 RepID=A0ABX8S6G8_9ACTN|nr:methionine synthase [Skermania piniformis]QXQ12762.1 methionine synthase [Skermania piniformis]